MKVNSEALIACAAQYMQALETVKDAVENYKAGLEALSNDWTGRAFVAMSGKVALLTANIVKSYMKITDADSELKKIADLFQETEESQKSTAAALEAGAQSPFQG